MRRRVFFLIAIISVFIISGCDYEAPEASSTEDPDTEITQENDDKSANDKESEAETEQKVQTLTTTADLNVRAGIGTSYDVVYVAPKGKELEMTGNSEQSDSGTIWYEVVTPYGKTGWCSGKYVELNGETALFTKEDTQQDAKAEKDDDSNVEETNKNNDMPTMQGTSVEIITQKARELGVVELYDEDFGHGARCKSLADSNWGLTLDVIYSEETKELLCASIVTMKSTTTKEQQKFVTGMVEVLCPLSDASDVSAWVNNNLGKSRSISINGFTYEVGLGPYDNILYNAGEIEWEEWDLSFQ